MAEKDASARLRRAVKENNLFLVKRLVQRTDMRNSDPGPRRYTSLAWAAVLGHEETFEFLLSSGHDDYEYSRDSENNYILMLLADQKTSISTTERGDTMRAVLRMARLYFDRYPKTLNWQNIHGRTPLHFASLKGNEELVRMFCDLGADFDLTDLKGNTPLHYASSWGHLSVVQLLIERGCVFAARNNEGFTASDYAYSFNTKDTLQETARRHFENKKNSRRAIHAQTSKGTERELSPPIAVPPVTRDRDYRRPVRMRSGSGTTATSDSGEVDSNGLAVGAQSSSSSPSQPSSNSQLPASQSSSSGFSQQPSHLNPSTTTISPFATRVRERDADAMEKYLRRNRSESQGTTSTENRSQNGSFSSAGPSANGDDISSLNNVSMSGSTTPRRVRPSISASQLRANSPPRAGSSQQSSEVRNRSGTGPTSPQTTTVLGRSSSASVRPPASGSETYTGPPSQYAQFPEPPSSMAESAVTPVASRRMAFHLNAHLDTVSTGANHRRGLSASVRDP
ncbi:ankyrin repeat-containing domain protein [Mycena floridula]|nr:ankyrin repeat-containing domain protein [Mycena floridula]